MRPMNFDPKLKFLSDSSPQFYEELKKRIAPIMIKESSRARQLTLIKLVLFPVLFAVTYTTLITAVDNNITLCLLYMLLGVFTPLIVMNIGHDAIHNCLFNNAKINRLASIMIDLLGADSFAWRMRHVHFHHPVANVLHWDIDLEPRKLFKLSPVDSSLRFHRFQHIYMPFIYFLFTFNWVFVQDFVDYFDPNSKFRISVTITLKHILKLFSFKFMYISYMLIIPMIVIDLPASHIGMAFFLMHTVAGVGVLIIVMPNHWDEHVEFSYPNDNNQIPVDWAYHQLKNTNDFAIHPVANFLMGGLNHHVAHHLFPHINHNYLPAITREIRSLSKELNLPYKSFTFKESLLSHFRLLKKNGLHSLQLSKLNQLV
jgi:linoleoyl-CoA desaturase